MSDTQSVLPWLKSLSNCLDKIKTGGYTENFKMVNNELFSVHKKQIYQPAEIKVVNSFRFEGVSDPKENVVMYIIETCDGLKGTMVAPCHVSTDSGLNAFMIAVKDRGSKVNKK